MQLKFFILFLLIGAFAGHAQSDSSLVPQKKQKYITVGVFGNSSFINYRAYLRDATAIRIGIDASLNETKDKVTYSNFPDATSSIRTIAVNTNLGIQTALLRLPRLETYIGADLSVGISNYLVINEYNRYTYDNTTDTYLFEYSSAETISGSYISPALRPFIGANFFVYKGLSLGVEYRVPLVVRNYQLSTVYSIVYKDVLGNVIDAPAVDPSSYKRSINKAQYSILGNTSVTVGFRIR